MTEGQVQSEKPLALFVSLEGIACSKAVGSGEARCNSQFVHVQDCKSFHQKSSQLAARRNHIPDHAPAKLLQMKSCQYSIYCLRPALLGVSFAVDKHHPRHDLCVMLPPVALLFPPFFVYSLFGRDVPPSPQLL